MINQKTLMIAGAAVGVALLAWLLMRGAKGAGEDIGAGAVNFAGGVVTGAVTTAGSIFGVPLTDAEKAAQARRKGDVWNASLYMPAAEFIAWMAAGMPKN